MTEFMQYAYVFLWAALALLCFIIGFKQKRIYGFVVAFLFVFMTVWYGLRAFAGLAMFDGALGVAFRVIMLTILAVCFIVFFAARRQNRR